MFLLTFIIFHYFEYDQPSGYEVISHCGSLLPTWGLFFLLLYYIFKTFWSVLGVQKNWTESTESSRILLQLPVFPIINIFHEYSTLVKVNESVQVHLLMLKSAAYTWVHFYYCTLLQV